MTSNAYKAFIEGYHAGYKGNTKNPYRYPSKEAKEWWLGCVEARVDIRNGR